MCGIVGYLGEDRAVSVLLNGLFRLEYRGYDSAGMAVVRSSGLKVHRVVGKVRELSELLKENGEKDPARSGIAHTRWATHGAPTRPNAHPHLDAKGKIALVHNGIIENYASLRTRLEGNGHVFHSETDSEVLAHLVGACYEGDLLQAVRTAMKQVRGTLGICAVSVDEPDRLIAARRGSPIVIGLGNGETIVASDVSAIASHTRQVLYLQDDEIADVTPGGVSVCNIHLVPVSRETSRIDWDPEKADLGEYEHFMLKEIFEQPEALRNAIRGRLDENSGTAILSGLNLTPREIADVARIVLVGCGTSLHAAMLGEYFFEDLADIPTDVEQAAEFRYRNPIIQSRDMVVALTQSGETADTLAAVREAVQKGALVSSICNVVASTIARESGRGVYLHAGPEIGVASTKAFTCQTAVLLMMALKFGRCRRLSQESGLRLVKEILTIPDLVSEVLELNDRIASLCERYASAEHCFFIGRGWLYPVAIEGALKLKEISYIHAEGYHAAELKHGPIALLEEKVPVIALANDLPGREKTLGNIQECRARNAPVLAITTRGDEEAASVADDVLALPPASPMVAPIPTVVALQLIAYHIARLRGCSIDQPRNLAKSVTVE